LSFRVDVTNNDSKEMSGEQYSSAIIVLAQCCIKIWCSAPRSELAQAFGNGCNIEFLLGQLLPSSLDTSLDEVQDPCAYVAADCPWLASDCGEVAWLTVSVLSLQSCRW
jgi:hypothetical protein